MSASVFWRFKEHIHGDKAMTAKVASQESTADPICPHCEKKLKEIHWRRISAWCEEYLYMCPHCHKVLGTGMRK